MVNDDDMEDELNSEFV
jgi:hypothetical protein